MSGTGMIRRGTRQPSTRKTWGQRLASVFYGMVLGLVIPSLALGQATLLPNAEQQYLDDAANPVAGGTVTYYIPSTSTKKTIWQDAAQTTPQANPVPLDGAGRPQPAGQTYGNGNYRQVVKDASGVTIWDNVTSSFGSGGGGSGVFTEGVMVGAIIAWANTTLPPKYLYTAGQAISRTTYADLRTALVYQPIIVCSSGVTTITVDVAISDSVPIGTPIEATCFAPGTTVAAKTVGQLTMSTPATVSASVTAVLYPWGNGNGSTTFNVPDLRGRTIAGRDNMGGTIASRLTSAFYGVNPDAANAVGGSQSASITLLTSNLPPYTPTGTVAGTVAGTVSITDPGHGHIVNAGVASIQVVSASGALVQQPGFSVTSTDVTGITASMAATMAATFTGAAQGGTSTAIVSSVIQPSLTSDYIIKALPDDLPSGPGVTSVQGMTGALFCGGGLICTAQTITAIAAGSIAVGSTAVTGGSNTNILYNNAGTLGEYPLATANNYNCATPGTLVQPNVVFQAETTTTYGATTVFDFCTFKNTQVTLTGDITTQTLANVVAGKAGMITFIQDGTGSRTTVWNSVFKFSGGSLPVLSTAPGAVDILTYSCRAASFCAASLLTDVR